MNYELAKQLKDAGFPFKDTWSGDTFKGGFYDPTLSELIEACTGLGNGFALFYNNGWKASMRTYPHTLKGKTPEEAVAKLWLELNKKIS